MSSSIPKNEILKQAMQKAKDNGWSHGEGWMSMPHPEAYDKMIIFDHDFAKAFWGEEKICNRHAIKESETHCSCYWEGGDFCKAWQHHLQQMVLEFDQLNYIVKFI